MERAPLIVGVLAYRRRPALEPRLVRGAHDYWRLLARVAQVEGTEVGAVEAVDAVPPVDDQDEAEAGDEDEDDDPGVLNPHPPYHGHCPVPHNKPHPLEP